MDPASSIGQYQILRELKHRTSNKLYVALGLLPNSPLYLLKIYKSQLGYRREKQVFSFENLYQNFFVEACDSLMYQGSNIQFIASRYSNCQSLIQMGMLIRQFPMDIVKFYMYDIFSKLKFIHGEKKIPFRTLHASDIVFGEDKTLFIVGWSKENQQVTEEQLIFDCSEIMYYMLTSGAFQQTGLGLKGAGKKRFLSDDFWDISKKKHPYLRYFPTDKAQLSRLADFFHNITVKNEDNPTTLQKVLSHPFFNQTPSFQVASQSLTNKQFQRISANKEKDLKNFDIKIKRAKIISQSFRSDEGQDYYEIIKAPFVFDTKNTAACENSLGDLVEKFLITKLNNNLNSAAVFDEEWTTLSQYQIKKCVKENKDIEYILDCQLKVIESEDVIPDIELRTFTVEVMLEEKQIGGSCIKSCSVSCNKIFNEILLAKFEQFVSEGLKQSFKYFSE